MGGSVLTGRMSNLTASHMPAERKDPHEEYFKMSLVSFKLNHPTEAELLKVDPDKLYREVKRTGLPFFKWSDWLWVCKVIFWIYIFCLFFNSVKFKIFCSFVENFSVRGR